MSQRFRYYLRVRYQDCDAQHVVFNARYGDYIDLACFEFLRAALPRPTDTFDGTFESQTVRQAIEWKAPARFDDVLEITVWTSRLGTTSFTLSFEMRRAGAAERSGDDQHAAEVPFVRVGRARGNQLAHALARQQFQPRPFELVDHRRGNADVRDHEIAAV